MEIDLPDLVAQRATRNGAAGRRWLDELPAVLAELTDRWQLDLGEPLTGGTAGYVVAATDSTGRPSVLKVAMPLDMNDVAAFARSVRSHRLADGRGCAALYAHDDARSALLLERLGPNLDQLGFTVPQLMETISATLLSFWRPVPFDRALRTGATQAEWLAGYVVASWDELGRPCRRAVIDRAVDYCHRRAKAFDPAAAVLVHGDAHGWNTLDAGGGAYKFVDPEGLWSERAHDLAVPMREYNAPLLDGDTPTLVRQRADLLAARCDVDPVAVWEWGFIERVSTGLASLRDFAAGDGAAFLEVAARCL